MAVFTEAIKDPFRDRDAFLDIACSGNEKMRQQGVSLLKAHERIGTFLEDSPTEASIE